LFGVKREPHAGEAPDWRFEYEMRSGDWRAER